MVVSRALITGDPSDPGEQKVACGVPSSPRAQFLGNILGFFSSPELKELDFISGFTYEKRSSKERKKKETDSQKTSSYPNFILSSSGQGREKPAYIWLQQNQTKP